MILYLVRVLSMGLGSIAGLIACAGPEVFSRPVYEDPTILVRLDSPLFGDRAASTSPPSASPLTASGLETVLQSVKVEREVDFLSYYLLGQDSSPEPMLTPEELSVLVPHVQAAVSKARPNETVVFVLEQVDDKGIPRATSGGLFRIGRQLGVVLANYHIPITAKAKREKIRKHPLLPLHETTFVHFVAGPYQTLAHDDRGAFPLPEPTPAPVLLIDYSALLGEKSRQPPPRATLPSTSRAPEVSHDRESAVARKLRQLKRWHDEGLITDEEYRKKKAALLDAF